MTKKFNYRFEKDNTMSNHQLYNVSVTARKTIDHMKISGNVYIDKKSLAIVNINLKLRIVVPSYLKPVMLVMGLSFKYPEISFEDQYREVNSTWFLQKVIIQGEGDALKRRMFKANDHSHFVLRQAFVSTSVHFGNVKPFSPGEIINKDRPLSRQLGKYDPEFWKLHNRIDFGTPEN